MSDADYLTNVVRGIVIAARGTALGGPGQLRRRAETRADELRMMVDFVTDPTGFLTRLLRG